MADADGAAERLLLEPALEIDQLALGAAAAQFAALDGGDAGRIVAAILKPLQGIDNERCHRRLADNRYNTAHEITPDEVSAAPV